MTIREYLQEEVFAARAAERTCLVVYDPARRYRDVVRGLDTPTRRVIDAGESIIEQREAAMAGLRQLASGSLHQLIVWSPTPPPNGDDQLQTDPFGVLTRIGKHFPDGDSDEFSSICRRAKPDHLVELDKLFGEGEPTFETIDALDQGGAWPKLKTLLNVSSAKEILLALLIPKPTQEAALKNDGTWASEAREFIQRSLGHTLHTKGQTRGSIAEELWRLVLFSEFVFDSGGEIPPTLTTVPRAESPARELVFDVCDDLRKHQDFRAAYITNAEEVSENLSLPERTAQMTNLGQRDTFAFEERFFLKRFVETVHEGQLDKAREILNRRQQSIWLTHEDRMAEWSVAERALELIESVEKQAVPSFPSLEAILHAYAGVWLEVDRRHREMEQAISEWHDDHDLLETLVASARQRYFKLASQLQAEFIRLVEAEGWPAHGSNLLRNAEVFDREVAPALEARQRVAYFLVDSLRYELAVELEKQLTAKHKVRLRTVCAQLPTYTEVGMASLMPEATTALSLVERDGKLVTTLGGLTATAPASRLSYLQSKKGDLCQDIELDDLIHQKKLKVADKVRLLVVRTREIDAVAHESPRGVLQLIPDLVRQIIRGVGRLEAAGFQKAVIATDHGFILVHDQEAGNVAQKPAGNWLIQKSRCLLGKGAGGGGSVVFNREQVGIPGDFHHYCVPRALVPYTRQHLYYHEGLSLQECVLPCLTVDLVAQQSKKSLPNLTITYKQGKTEKITTRRPVIDIAWPEGSLFLDESDIEISVEAFDSKGQGVGWVGSGPTVNLATQGVRIRPGQVVSVSLRMEDNFSGVFTVRATDPGNQALIAELKLKTDYAV